MDSGQEFKVREGRKPGHFWAYNEILDEFAPIIGAYGFAVYMALCRHASLNGECKFTLRQMAVKLAVSPQTVMRSLQKLQDSGLIIEIEKSNSLYKPSIIQLVDTHDFSTVPIGNSNRSYKEQLPPSTVPIGNTDTNTNTKKQGINTPPLFEIPDKSKEITELPEWKEFIEMRRKAGHPLVTDGARSRMIARLFELQESGQDIKKVLQQSCDKTWTDVYEVKPKNNGNHKKVIIEPEEDALEVMRRKEQARRANA